jgi:hypothetical protein
MFTLFRLEEDAFLLFDVARWQPSLFRVDICGKLKVLKFHLVFLWWFAAGRSAWLV